MKRLVTSARRHLLLLLMTVSVALLAHRPLQAQNSFILSRNADFSTDDRVFETTDTLYMKVTAPDIDFTDIDDNEFELKAHQDGDKVRGSFDNQLNTMYTAKLALADLNSSQTMWRWKAKISDKSGNDFRAEVEIEIRGPNQTDQVEIRGRIEELGADFIVVKGTKIFVDANTQIVDKNNQPLSFADLNLQTNVFVQATVQADGTTLATFIQVNDRNKGEVEVKGQIDSVGVDHVFVLGQKFLVDANTEIQDANKDPITLADLAVGQFVEIKARPQEDGSLLAVRIRVEDESDKSKVELTGFVEEVTDTSVTVSGIVFLVDDNTEILGRDENPIGLSDLQEGQLVEVKAQVQSDGTLLATKIKLEDDVPGENEVEVKGEIQVLGDGEIQVSGVVFLVDDNTRIVDERGREIAFADLQVGVVVEVKAVVQADGSFLATKIKIEDRLKDELEITGTIEALTDTSVTVDGREFLVDANTEILDDRKNPIDFADLSEGQLVEIRAEILADGTLLATRIKLEDEDKQKVEVTGAIESIGPDSLVVSGITFFVDASTLVLDANRDTIDFAMLNVGQVVKVKGILQADSSFLAVKIQVKKQVEDEVRVKGPVDAITATEITVANVTFSLLDNTEFLDNNKNPISPSDITPGTVVEVRGQLLPGGTLIALRVKVEDVSAEQLEVRAAIDSVGANNVVVLGINLLVDSNTEILDKQNNPIGLGDLSAGLFVEAQATRQADGSFLATRIKVKDVLVVGGSLTSVDANSLTVFNAPLLTDSNTLVLGAFNVPKTLADLSPGQNVDVRAAQLDNGSFLATRVKILGTGTVTGISDNGSPDAESVPDGFALLQNYPNPFNPTTTIVFNVPEGQTSVRLVIFNVLGQEVLTLVDQPLQSGVHRIQWDGRDRTGRIVPSGIYLYRLKAGKFTETRRMILLK